MGLALPSSTRRSGHKSKAAALDMHMCMCVRVRMHARVCVWVRCVRNHLGSGWEGGKPSLATPLPPGAKFACGTGGGGGFGRGAMRAAVFG